MSRNSNHNFPHISNEEGKKQSLKSKKLEIEGYLIKYKKYKLRLECFDSLTVINQNTFSKLTSLETLTIGENVKTIGNWRTFVPAKGVTCTDGNV